MVDDFHAAHFRLRARARFRPPPSTRGMELPHELASRHDVACGKLRRLPDNLKGNGLYKTWIDWIESIAPLPGRDDLWLEAVAALGAFGRRGPPVHPPRYRARY